MVDSINDVGGTALLGAGHGLVQRGFTGEGHRRGHASVHGELDVRHQTVTHHEAVLEFQIEAREGDARHFGVRLAQDDLGLRVRAGFDCCYHGRAVGLAFASREGAETIRVRANEGRATVEPDGVDMDRFRETHFKAQMIRSRYTILDVLTDIGKLDDVVDKLFAPDGYWGKHFHADKEISNV